MPLWFMCQTSQKIMQKFFKSTFFISKQKNCAITKRFIEGIVIKICVADAKKHVLPSLAKPDRPFVPFW